MADANDLKAKLGLPPVSQIGVIVRDVNKAAEYYSSLFGVGPFTIYDFVPEKHLYWGEPTYAKLRMAKAPWGNIELELIQPLEGKSPHMDWFQKHGEGIQHLGFIVRDFDSLYKNFIAEGFKPLLESGYYSDVYKGEVKVTYFDTDKLVGVLFEIIWKSWLPECQ
jgi:methylmalonyl-CoA/ethylmalonyl-CoA epimerase